MTGDAPPLLRGYRPHAALLLLVAAVYVPCASFGLTLLDDNVFFEKQLPFLSRWSNLPSLFAHRSMLGAAGPDDYYRPLLSLSFMVDVLLGGGSLVVAHVSNVVYHAIATLLVFSMFRKLGYGDRSIVLAGIFAVHPVLAQAVAWIPGRTDALLAVFLIASFNAFLDHVQEPKPGALARHFGFLALALLVKELAIVLPALCLLFAWGKLDSRRRVTLILGWSLLLSCWYALRTTILWGAPGFTASEVRSLFANMPAALVYAAKCWLPLDLQPYPTLQDAAWPFAIGGLALLGVVLALRRPAQPRRALWAAAWFGIFLLPSFLYPARSITPVFFEYRAYLPLIGMLVLLGETGAVRSLLPWTALIALFAVGAAVNSRSYRDPVTCWERATAGSPRSAFAHKQLGAAYLRAGDPARAEVSVRKSIELNPREPGAHNNLGTLLLKSGRVGEAIGEYRRELEVDPTSADARYNLGLAYLQLGRNDQAAEMWQQTIAADPGFIDAYVNLAAVHVLKGDTRTAERHAREALRRGGTLPPELVRRIPELSR